MRLRRRPCPRTSSAAAARPRSPPAPSCSGSTRPSARPSRRVEAVDLDATDLEAAGAALAAELGRHAALLADRVLAPMTEAMPRKQMRELGGRYTDIRDAVLRDEGADEPPPRRLDVSRAELYELAKRAGIEGRSSMSRRDLINELQRQQQQPS